VNGIQENSSTRNVTFEANAVTRIGVFYTSLGLFLDGKIGVVRSYNRALSYSEVIQNFEAERSIYNVTGVTKDGLTLWLDAGNYASYNGSGTTWYDISGNVFDATLINGPTYSSDGGGSIFFDGTNDNGTLNPSVIPSGTQITISFWNNGAGTIASSIISASQNSSEQTLNIHLPWSNGQIYWDCGSPINRITKAASTSEYLGWHNWVFTKNSTTGNMYIYLDGSLWHSGSGLTSTIPVMNIASIGNYFTGTLPHWGNIGQCLIYNRELSSTEIAQNFNAGRGRYGV
jgi:hypothetical protein